MAPERGGGDLEESLLRQQCLYEILGVDRSAGIDEIRSAYRKQALKWHPDKIQQSGASPEACNDATVRFQAIARAYEVLGDPTERAWYDSHRSAILSSSSSSSSQTPAEFDFNLWPFFSPSAFSGFGESGDGFYAVYRKVFQKLHEQERMFARAYGDGLVQDAPELGGPHSPYSQVSAFYNYWLGFGTVKDFAWCDEYRVSAAPNRKSRRLMEEENKKIRRKARKEFNEAVRQLAAFVKKRDKRVMERQIETQRLQKEKELMLKVKRQQLEQEKLARIQQYEEQEWARSRNEGVNDESIESDSDQNSYDYVRVSKGKKEPDISDDENRELYCIICGKKFRSERQWQNHEKSKKHIERAAALKDSLLEEDEEAAVVIEQRLDSGDHLYTQEDEIFPDLLKDTKMPEGYVSVSIDEAGHAYGTEGGRVCDIELPNLHTSRVHRGDEASQSADQFGNDVESSKLVGSSDSESAGDSGDDESSMLAAMLKSHNSRLKTSSFDPVEVQVDMACKDASQENSSVALEEGVVESPNEFTEFDPYIPGRKPSKSRTKQQKRKTAALERHTGMVEEVSVLGATLEKTDLGEVSNDNGSSEAEAEINSSQQDGNHKSKIALTSSEVEDVKTTRSTRQAANRSQNNSSEQNKSAKSANFQSEPGKKGKKKKGGVKTSANTCDTCGEDFDTRNQLFKHIDSAKHFTLKLK
ncbi:hypothetical protein O6H91_15G050900 [Diphasiastrum complanatum]|uniref:Uncharacterized protein n=1 Tax=Diphasiastrum complanatum TaxID=34168 RepID=A0ACC2BI65_DIPCM|nr:hypothetical protein O6H91_15G050900 [Diphasiastrum complanatum]